MVSIHRLVLVLCLTSCSAGTTPAVRSTMEVAAAATGLLLRTPRAPAPAASTSIRRTSVPPTATVADAGSVSAVSSESSSSTGAV